MVNKKIIKQFITDTFIHFSNQLNKLNSNYSAIHICYFFFHLLILLYFKLFMIIVFG